MKKRYTIKDLDCCSCANKLEELIAAVDGVKRVNISFMTQRLSIDIDETNFSDSFKKVVDIVKDMGFDVIE